MRSRRADLDAPAIGIVSANLRVELLDSGDAARNEARDRELDEFFEACPTSFAQQTRHWRDVIAPLAGDEPLFLVARDPTRGHSLVGVLPSYRFAGRLGAVLNSVPQAGPLGGVAVAAGVEAEPVYRALLGAYVELGRSTKCAAVSVISNPFWPDLHFYRRHLEPEFTLRNDCLALDLEKQVDADGGFPAGSSHLRRNLRKARAAGLRVEEGHTPEEIAAWYEIHAARHHALHATPLPQAMFSGALRHMVPRGKARFFLVRDPGEGDRLLAGGFYILHGRVIDALMPAVSAAGAERGANYLLAEHTIHWARARGLRFYNWQGSPPAGGVQRFKQQWGSSEFRYCYFTRVTGDIEPLLSSTPAAVRDAYPWHFTLPFDAIGQPGAHRGGNHSRRAAWKAADSGR